MAAESNVRALAPRQANAVSVRPDNLDTLTVAKMLAESGFFGEVKQAGQALAKILAGQELGMGPIASLMGVFFTNGKISYSANIMASAIQRSGRYDYRVTRLDDDGCALEFFQDGRSIGKSEFSRDDAVKAKLTTGNNQHNYEKYPRNMFFARAMSNGAKWFCAGVFGGVTPYTPEELGAEVVVSDDGEMVPIQAEVIATPIGAKPELIEPTAEETARAAATVPDATNTRDLAEARFAELAEQAIARNHPKSDKIATVEPSKLTDRVLTHSIKDLEDWLKANPPADDEAF